MSGIYDFLREQFSGPEPKIFFECGAHTGSDTVQLAAFPNVVVHCWEPDPRNRIPHLGNVVANRCAVGAIDGSSLFCQSTRRGGQPWTLSGSLREPTGHLAAYPDVEFAADPIAVPVITLDSYARAKRIEAVDFIWADVQGCEDLLIRGARRLLERTRFFYTEYCNTALYDGEKALAELLEMLPGWAVLRDYPSGEVYGNVLLSNQRL